MAACFSDERMILPKDSRTLYDVMYIYRYVLYTTVYIQYIYIHIQYIYIHNIHIHIQYIYIFIRYMHIYYISISYFDMLIHPQLGSARWDSGYPGGRVRRAVPGHGNGRGAPCTWQCPWDFPRDMLRIWLVAMENYNF